MIRYSAAQKTIVYLRLCNFIPQIVPLVRPCISHPLSSTIRQHTRQDKFFAIDYFITPLANSVAYSATSLLQYHKTTIQDLVDFFQLIILLVILSMLYHIPQISDVDIHSNTSYSNYSITNISSFHISHIIVTHSISRQHAK